MPAVDAARIVGRMHETEYHSPTDLPATGGYKSASAFNDDFDWPTGRRVVDPTAGHPRMRHGGGAVRLADAADDFLAAAADGRTRDPSGLRYSEDALEELRVALGGHVAEELGDIPLTSLRRWQVQGFVNELADSGLSLRRLRAIVAALRALTRYAREQGMLDDDPTRGVTVPTEDDPQPLRPFTTTDQLDVVQPAAPSPMIPDAALWQLMKVVTVVFILIAIVLAAESI